MRTRSATGSLLLAVALFGLSSVMPAFAAGDTESAEASVITYAWFWKDQQQQKVTIPADGSDAATLELKNPYCPDTSPAGSPPPEACKPGRLPVEVRGDYEEPHKLSAINFDLSLVPLGSKIKKFEVRLWEAQDEVSRSTQYNLDGKQIQACEIAGVFGEGEARLYKEIPKFKCTPGDATAKRDSTTVGKGTDEKEVFFWDLNLTAQAQEWAKNEEFFTSVMLFPKPPKAAEKKSSATAVEDAIRDAAAAPQDDAWQVVFAGPVEAKYGIDTTVVYDPPEIEEPEVPEIPEITDPGEEELPGTDTPPTGSDFSSTSGTPTTSTTTSGTGTATSGGAPTADADATGDADDTATEDPTLAADEAALASDEETAPSGMPLYMWLAILAGMVGFTLVRSVVLEKNTGIRPDGVLAQIQKLNAQRRGTAVAATAGGTSAFAGLAAGLGAIGNKVTGAAGKLAQLVSKKKG